MTTDPLIKALVECQLGFARAHRRIVRHIVPKIQYNDELIEREHGGEAETSAEDLLVEISGCYGLGAGTEPKIDSEPNQEMTR